MHKALKVALQPWPTLVGMKSLIDFGLRYEVGDTYFRSDWFCSTITTIEDRRAIRRQAIDTASRTNDGPVVPVLVCERNLYQRP